MKKNWIWIIVAVAFVGVMVGAYFLYDHFANQEGNGPALEDVRESTDSGEDPMAAPDFTVYDANGKAVKLSDMRGKPVIVNIWASWCGPCKSEMPGFEAMYEKYGQDIHFMMVNLTGQDTMADAQAYIRDAGYTFPVYYDTDNSAAANYSTGSVPVSYFLSSKGELVTYAMGAIPEETLEQGISMILE